MYQGLTNTVVWKESQTQEVLKLPIAHNQEKSYFLFELFHTLFS